MEKSSPLTPKSQLRWGHYPILTSLITRGNAASTNTLTASSGSTSQKVPTSLFCPMPMSKGSRTNSTPPQKDTRLPNPSRDFLQRQKSARCTSLLMGIKTYLTIDAGADQTFSKTRICGPSASSVLVREWDGPAVLTALTAQNEPGAQSTRSTPPRPPRRML